MKKLVLAVILGAVAGAIITFSISSGVLRWAERGREAPQVATYTQTGTASAPAPEQNQESAKSPALEPVAPRPEASPAAAASRILGRQARRTLPPQQASKAAEQEEGRVSDAEAQSEEIASAKPSSAQTTHPEPRVAEAEPMPSGSAPAAPHATPPAPRTVTIPAGQVIAVRLQQKLSSETNQAEDSFVAHLAEPLVVDGLVLAEKGARAEGRVVAVERSGKIRGLARLAVQLVRLETSDGQSLAIQTDTFENAADKSTRDDAVKIGIGSAIGAAIGAIAGGGKGAAIGAAAGGGAGTGAVLATRGRPAEIPSEARIPFRLALPVTVTEKLR